MLPRQRLCGKIRFANCAAFQQSPPHAPSVDDQDSKVVSVPSFVGISLNIRCM